MFMQAGFAMVETGFCRAKNAAHTMSMNFMVYPLGMFAYWVCGYAIQMGGVGGIAALGGDGSAQPRVHDQPVRAQHGPLRPERLLPERRHVRRWRLHALPVPDGVHGQGVTIPTGAMAERWKWSSFCLFALFMGAFVYPVFANWVWGGGWLATLGSNFGLGHGHVDFAGSSVVHMVGGVAARRGRSSSARESASSPSPASRSPFPATIFR